MKVRKICILFIAVLTVSFLFAQSIESPKKSVNIHGVRIPESSEKFELLTSNIQKTDKTVQMDFTFNQGINPHSIDNKSVIINDGKISIEDSKKVFSKDGKTLRIIFNSDLNQFKVELRGIKSFSDSSLENISLTL